MYSVRAWSQKFDGCGSVIFTEQCVSDDTVEAEAERGSLPFMLAARDAKATPGRWFATTTNDGWDMGTRTHVMYTPDASK